MSKWKISLYLTVLFLAGVVTGGVITITIGRQMMSGTRMASRWRHELESKLQLTPEQVLKIDPILKDSMANFGALLADQMLISMSNCNAQIRTNLTPEQQSRFTEIEAQQIRFVQGFRTGKPPHDK